MIRFYDENLSIPHNNSNTTSPFLPVSNASKHFQVCLKPTLIKVILCLGCCSVSCSQQQVSCCPFSFRTCEFDKVQYDQTLTKSYMKNWHLPRPMCHNVMLDQLQFFLTFVFQVCGTLHRGISSFGVLIMVVETSI